MFDRKKFGDNLNFYRNLRHMSLNDCSDAFGISRNNIFNMTKGRHTPKVSTVISILKAFDITYSELMMDRTDEDAYSQYLISRFEQLSLRNKKLCCVIAKIILEGSDGNE